MSAQGTRASETPALEVISARRTESLDAPNILKLVDQSTEMLFGRVNIVNLIERALLAVTLSNESEEMLGHAAFLDYPNVPGVEPSLWLPWLMKTFDSTVANCDSLNTLFVHYFVSKPDYSQGCASEIIRTMFNAIPELHYCLLAVPVGVQPDPALGELFKKIKSRHAFDSNRIDTHDMFVCQRHQHVPVLYIREARVEDNDDLTPIFNRQTDVLGNTYGEYYLAELIEAQDDKMKCIVAEVEGVAIGFMSLYEEVDVDLLNECFELAPFQGLRATHCADAPGPGPDPKLVPEEEIFEREAAHAEEQEDDDGEEEEEEEEEEEKKDEVAEENVDEFAFEDTTETQDETTPPDSPTVKGKLADSPMSPLIDLHDDAAARAMASERSLSSASAPVDMLRRFCKPVLRNVDVISRRCVPQYFGPASTFCIQLFCIDERYEMRSCDFLPKAFELFPKKQYCIITVPHMVPEFPLLQQFMRVTPRVPSTLPQELYIFSAAGLYDQFFVRPPTIKDKPEIMKLVKTLKLSSSLVADLQQYYSAHRDNDGTDIQVFVAEVLRQIVGIAIIRQEEDIEYIRAHYNIEDFIYFNHHRRDEHGHLHHYALNPIFKHKAKNFLKEILRLGNKTSLYYPLYPPYVDDKILRRHTLVASLNNMVPVRARRQICYPLKQLGINAPSERVLQVQEQYALNHINRKLVLEPKVMLNARIVVVGASDVGIAFLETFAFCPHLRFNNLTLISPHGLPGDLPPNEWRDHMFAKSQNYSQDEYAQMSLRTWVNVVYGKMTGIDTCKKQVEVDGSYVVPYDHLILCTGLQYQIPTPTGADIAGLATNDKIPNDPCRRYEGEPLKNVFVINDSYDAAVALYWLEDNIFNTRNRVIVYGSTLDAYCCVQAMLSIGLEGRQIVLVEPPPKSSMTCFNDQDVERAVAVALADAGVEMHSGYILAEWNNGDGGDIVTMAGFTGPNKPLRIKCSAFFSFYERLVDYDAFRAINCACLVYDGRLVIDAKFHTNNVSIRGAGTLTKYQRIYYAKSTHIDYNSKEIGIELASTMLSLFDPTIEGAKGVIEEEIKLAPKYHSPKIRGGMVPGGYHYLHVQKPGSSDLLSVLQSGREMITGKPGERPEYFRLLVNKYNTIDIVTCLSRKPFSTSNLLCLYGIHERYLNNLVSRYDEGLISDFFSYFDEPWAMAVFHDRFLDFRDEIREFLITRQSEDVQSVEEYIRSIMDEDGSLNKEQKSLVRNRFELTGCKKAVEMRLLNYITYNYYHLPMYAKPGMI